MAQKSDKFGKIKHNKFQEEHEGNLVRACLLSIEGQISVYDLQQDFKSLVGRSIEYRQFGHQTLNSFLESLREVKTRRQANGEIFLMAGLTEKTAQWMHTFGKSGCYPDEVGPRLQGMSINVKAEDSHGVGTVKDDEKSEEPPEIVSAKRKRILLLRYHAEMAEKEYGFNFATGKNFCKLHVFLKKANLPAATYALDYYPEPCVCILVGCLTFSGFAKSNESLDVCMEETASEALEVLAELDLPWEAEMSKPMSVTNRLMALIYDRPLGIWRDSLPKEYAKKHNEELPEKWAEDFLCKAGKAIKVIVIPNLRNVQTHFWIPKLVNQPCMLYDSYIRSWRSASLKDGVVAGASTAPPDTAPAAATGRPGPPATPATPAAPATGPDSVVRAVLGDATRAATRAALESEERFVLVERLQMSVGGRYCVAVNHVTASSGMWVRIAGKVHGPVFERLKRDMTEHFARGQPTKVEHPSLGACYGALFGGGWHRVMVTRLDDDGTGAVFLIDIGVEDKLKLDGCFVLPSEFTAVPAMAVCIVLDHFKELSGNPEYQKVLQQLVNMGTYTAEVVCFETGSPSVNLVGVNDVNVNYQIADLLVREIVREHKFSPGQVMDVRISHVDKSGVVFARIEDVGQKLLRVMLLQLRLKLQTQAPTRAFQPVVGTKRYFASLVDAEETGCVDEAIYRLVVLSAPDIDSQVEVFLTDVGRHKRIHLHQIYNLEDFFRPLGLLPAQAMAVALTNVPPSMFTSQLVAKVKELVPAHLPVLMKIIKPSELFEVELFRRIFPENVLVSVNNSIALDCSLKQPPADAESVGAAALPPMVCPIPPTLVMLPVAVIPEIGSQFDVNVPMVSNPQNFVVQPWDTYYLLQHLMYQMQQLYVNNNRYQQLTAKDVIPGHGYVALHPDGNWYRVIASPQVVNEDSILASFADYGDLQVLQVANMRYLAPEFCKLPCQAIRAGLYGVKPLHHDWCVQDCIDFQALVNERQFVSIVKSKPKDCGVSGDVVVSLKLIDTTGSEDLHIDQILVSKGIAKYIDSGA